MAVDDETARRTGRTIEAKALINRPVAADLCGLSVRVAL
jgi:hypothetical protein